MDLNFGDMKNPKPVERLSERELLELINSGLDNFEDDKDDADVIEEYCERLYSEFGYRPSDEGTARRRFLEELSAAEPKKKEKGLRSRLVAFMSAMAALIVLFVSGGQIADAFGYNIRLNILEWGKSINNMPVGTDIDDGDMSARIYDDNDVKTYKSAEKLSDDLGIKIMYPGYLPVNYRVEEINKIGDTVQFFFNKPSFSFTIKNKDAEFFDKIKESSEKLTVGGKEVYIAANKPDNSHTSSYIAYFSQGELVYAASFYDKNILVNVIKNLKAT